MTDDERSDRATNRVSGERGQRWPRPFLFHPLTRLAIALVVLALSLRVLGAPAEVMNLLSAAFFVVWFEVAWALKGVAWLMGRLAASRLSLVGLIVFTVIWGGVTMVNVALIGWLLWQVVRQY